MLAQLLTIVLTTLAPKAPTLIREEGARYVAINPRRTRIVMQVHCVGGYEDFYLNLPPNAREEVTITEPDGGNAMCVMESYRGG